MRAVLAQLSPDPFTDLRGDGPEVVFVVLGLVYIGLLIFMMVLAWRFVRAAERIAKA